MSADQDWAAPVAPAIENTLAYDRFGVRISESYGDDDDLTVTWEAVGRVDLAAGAGRLNFHTADGQWFRDVYVSGSEVYERLAADSTTWRQLRAEQPDESPLTNEFFGLCALARAVSRWEGAAPAVISDGTPATRHTAILHRRLGDHWDGAIPLVFRETLLPAVIRRRLLYVWIDDEHRLRALAVTTDRPGIRFARQWLRLDVLDFKPEPVPPMTADHVLTGPVGSQLHQQLRNVRSHQP